MTMQKKYLIGVDLGTSGTKAALYQIDGKLISDASVEVPLYYPKPGVVEQENEDFYTSAAQTVKKCVESSGVEPKEIASIAFDSQMAGIGLIDEDFKPVTRFELCGWICDVSRLLSGWTKKPVVESLNSLAAPPLVIMGPKCSGGRMNNLNSTSRLQNLSYPELMWQERSRV